MRLSWRHEEGGERVLAIYPEWWRVQRWWNRSLCALTDHPGFKPAPHFDYIDIYTGWTDDRPMCVRCSAPDPDAPVASPPSFHGFSR